MKRDVILKRTAVFLFFGLILIVLFNIFGILDLREITGFAVFEGPGEGQITLMLQEPDTENLGDAYVLQGSPNTNFGSETDLIVKWGGSNQRNSYLNFNISGISENQIIDNATLCVYLYYDRIGDLTISAHQVNSALEEDTITWNNQPCGVDFGDPVNCNLTAESSLTAQDETWQCWKVDDMVRKDYNAGKENVSIVLHTENSSTYADFFYSKEYTDDISLIPYLNITYHSANLAPSITLTEPQAQLYTSNESLSLNFSVSDADGNLDSCWYNIDNGDNLSLGTEGNCQNTTFNVFEAGTYTLTIFANDSYGLEDSDSVSFTVDLTGISVSISQPRDKQTSKTGIPLQFDVIGNNLACWYNLTYDSGGGIWVAYPGKEAFVIIPNCSSTTFSVADDYNYILYLSANNTYGSSDSDFSEFSVDTSVLPPNGGEEDGGGGGGGGGGSSIPLGLNVEITPIKVIVYPGEEKSLQASVKNKGIKTLNKCKLVGGEGWIEADEIKNIGGGEIVEFKFILKVPRDAEGQPSVSLECMDYSAQVPLEVILIISGLNIEFSKIDLVSRKELSVIYFVEADTNTDAEIVFTVSDSEGVVSEKTVQVEVSQSEKLEAEVLLDISGAKTGELKISVAVAGEEKPMIEDSILYDSKLRTGFAVRDILTDSRTYVWLIVIVFLVVAFFIVRRISGFKKKHK